MDSLSFLSEFIFPRKLETKSSIRSQRLGSDIFFAKDIVDTFENGFQTLEGKKLGTQVRQDATIGHLVNWWTYWKYHGKWSLYEFNSPLCYDTGMFEEIADSDISIYTESLGKVYNRPK